MTFDTQGIQDWDGSSDQSLAEMWVRETMSSQPALSSPPTPREIFIADSETKLDKIRQNYYHMTWVRTYERELFRRWFLWNHQRSKPVLTERVNTKSALSLEMGGEYSPSADLIQYWIDGVKAFRHSAKLDDEIPLSVTSRSEIAAEFSRRIISLIGSYSQRKRTSSISTFQLTKSHRFAADFSYPAILRSSSLHRAATEKCPFTSFSPPERKH